MLSDLTTRFRNLIWLLIFSFIIYPSPHLKNLFPYQFHFSFPEAQAADDASDLGGGNLTLPDPENTLISGALSLKIPIKVSPGRAGIAPDISLVYSSSQNKDLMGVGWSLDMGAIKRSTKKGLNYSDNNYVEAKSGSTAELLPRGDWGTNYYGQKIEGSFSKYYLNPSTGGWEVTSKGGTRYFFGTTSASRQDNALGIFKWCLDKVQDTNGNYMTITYWKDQGEIYLGRIDYTGNGSISPTNTVYFYYESRPDAPVMYATNAATRMAFRLKTIDIISNGSRVNVYQLSYSINRNTNQSLLSSVQLFGNDAVLDSAGGVTSGTSSSPQTFTYSEIEEHFNWYLLDQTAFGNVGSKIKVGDFNGDGQTDLYFCDSSGNHRVGLSTGSSITWSTWAQNNFGDVGDKIRVGDFNGDGKADLYYYDNNGNLWVGLSTGTSITWTTWAQNNFGDAGDRIRVGDFNGDGKSDLYYYLDSQKF